jgi:thiosulfate/3-mercaptopyruvate sulfurtransferase
VTSAQKNVFAAPKLAWRDAELASPLGGAGVKIIDVRAGEEYAMGQVPGALHFGVYGVNTYDTDDAPLASFVRMRAFLLRLRGITRDNTVVVYDEISGMSAAGLFPLAYGCTQRSASRRPRRPAIIVR